MTSIKFRALTHDDHKFFFEALGEFGKDFQNIQQYMAQKSGKTGANKTSSTSSSSSASEQNKSTIDAQEKRDHDKKEEDKKREQIRNFYNKLYTKLSQLVNLAGKIDDRVEKVNQELYLLINYGEIWKKHGFKFNNKTKKLLEELVYQGYTTLRFKNKNVRLRTPTCKALKKINGIGIDEKEKVVTSRELPKEVIVEFHPATNRDWLKVQSMSQNPLVRARLSIHKRLSNILEFLESKWSVSHDKLNRTVDVWLKVPISAQAPSEPNSAHHVSQNLTNGNYDSSNNTTRIGVPEIPNSNEPAGDQPVRQKEVLMRLRLKPSALHELKEVNITRVVPDTHLDLSLHAYIRRMGDVKPKINGSPSKASHSSKDSSNPINNQHDVEMLLVENCEISQGALSTGNSRNLPLSLTTPDSSILFERSCTSDQPSFAQARKHLNILQSLAGTFEGCENSRTACEETQDRLLLGGGLSHGDHSRSNFGSRVVSFADSNRNRDTIESVPPTSIPALFDEDAAIDSNLATMVQHERPSAEQLQEQVPGVNVISQHIFDCQNSKSVDFHIPKNVTLGDWFKMNGQGDGDGDDANDAFPSSEPGREALEDVSDVAPTDEDNNNSGVSENISDSLTNSGRIKQPESNASSTAKPQNHMIEIKKFAEGWTKLDERSITIGELYLAFKCPDKIVLEYEFEQFPCENQEKSMQSTVSDSQVINCNSVTQSGTDNKPDNTFIFKLLTAASLSLAHIERQKLEQQHRLQDQQSSAKLKRRKGQGQMKSLHDIEMNNQRVEEELKKLRSSKLTFKRAR